MRRLLLLRHAKAEPEGSGPDFDRALAGRGRKNARAMGAYVEKQGLAPDFAAVSPALRTRQTWELMSDELEAACTPSLEPALYGTSERMLLSIVHAAPAKFRNVMLVGHNPGLERLAKALIGEGSRRDLESLDEKFPTCALAVIDFDIGGWKELLPRQGALKSFVIPADLAEA